MLATRAVQRQIDAGSHVTCAACDQTVKFVASVGRVNRKQVVCNVYVGGKWDRVEHYHLDCYTEAGQPHGPVGEDTRVFKPKTSP